MDQVRESDTVTDQLEQFLESTRVDDDIVEDDYVPARVETPDVPDSDDLPVKTASTSEDDESKALEVKSGTAETGQERGWYTVEFEEPFSGALPPAINATAVQRTGDFSKAQYQPPSFQVGGVEFIEVSQVSLDQVQVGEVDGKQVSLGQVSAGTVSVGGIEIADIEISVPQISERSLQHQADVSQEGISVSTPQLGQNINFGQDLSVNVDFSFSEKNFQEDLSGKVDYPSLEELKNEIEEFDPRQQDNSNKTIEELMKEGSRDGASAFYDFLDEALPDALNDVPGVSIKTDILNAFDFTLKRVYGAGETEYNGNFNDGEGVYESIYGLIGSILDDAIQFIVQQLVGFDRDTIDTANADLIQLREDLVGDGGVIDELEAIIGDEIQDLINDELGNLDSLASETDNALQGIGSEVEQIVQGQQEEINSEIVSAIENMSSQVNEYAKNDVQGSLESVDSALGNTEQEINALSSEASEQMQLLGEDVNVGFTDVTQQIQEQVNVLNDEIQVSINDTLQQTVAGVNNQIQSIQQQTNDALLVNQQETNVAIQDLAEQINVLNEDLQAQTNDSMITLKEDMNASIDQNNTNFSNMENRVNSALSEVTAQAETAVNESLTVLYDTMGMPKGELMVPVQVRNVSNEGFEFLGYEGGTKIQWNAMSRSGAGNIVGNPVGGGGSDGDGGGDGGGGQIGEGQIEEIVDRVEERLKDSDLQL